VIQVKIVSDVNAGYFSASVAEALNDGWELYGNVVVRNNAFAVMLLRNDKPPLDTLLFEAHQEALTNMEALAEIDKMLPQPVSKN